MRVLPLLAVLASMRGTGGFLAPFAAPRALKAGQPSSVRMSANVVEDAVSNIVDAEGLSIRQPPGDVKLDQSVLDK